MRPCSEHFTYITFLNSHDTHMRPKQAQNRSHRRPRPHRLGGQPRSVWLPVPFLLHQTTFLGAAAFCRFLEKCSIPSIHPSRPSPGPHGFNYCSAMIKNLLIARRTAPPSLFFILGFFCFFFCVYFSGQTLVNHFGKVPQNLKVF